MVLHKKRSVKEKLGLWRLRYLSPPTFPSPLLPQKSMKNEIKTHKLIINQEIMDKNLNKTKIRLQQREEEKGSCK